MPDRPRGAHQGHQDLHPRHAPRGQPDAPGPGLGGRPTAEDPAYADECQNLVDSLGLQANVRFLGMQKVEELLPKVGVVVLSSISEALPW